LADVGGGAIAFLGVQRLAPSLWPGRVADLDGGAIFLSLPFFLKKIESWRVPCSPVALRM